MDNSNIQNNHNFSFIVLISCIATIGGFLFGFDSGVINGTVDGLRTAFNSDSMGTGFNVASMLLGCAVGAAMAGRLADFYGRRTMLILAAIFFIVSAWGSGVAGGSVEFIIYRVLGGLAVGAASVMAPAYISEVAPAAYRGRLTTIQQVAIISGLTAAFLSNYLLADISGSALSPLWLGFDTWRWMFWVEILPAAIFLGALMLIPESPRFLVSRQQKEKALAVLKKLYGDAEGEAKYTEIDQSLAKDHHRPALKDLIDSKTGRIRRLVWVGIGLATFQQLVGINVVFYYGAVLWQSVGFSENDALLINVVSGALSIAACVVALLLVDKIGRKPLLWIGSAGMAVTLTLCTIAFATASFDDSGQLSLTNSMGTLALISANLYVIFFNLSWGPVMWVMLGEMFPNQIRGSGLAVAGLFQWGSNFAITITFPILLAGVGLAGAYGFYAFCAFVSVVFIMKYVHETKGVELEDMKG
ncbi:sugar porter family MFS transporter [Marinagarivorans cellulosilyticus]|uniref:D-xylose-proton symporter n=1 Tax=Marinagarivorans cellulosilyticus TaxID=2721545 RepID=A0AAN2BKJ3_9GAMM|nr:sugar porter family MFS transporter [Marinagarivorans cellulosilyticus]BCD98025.1 MFS transporter, SP family, sugar:H+ symporter [Marinagarivorans cellulosilyticus]